MERDFESWFPNLSVLNSSSAARLSRLQHSIAPIQIPVFNDNLLVGPKCAQKSFLVFDQTGNQTTLFFSSGINGPDQFPTCWNPKLPNVYNPIGIEPGTKFDPTNNPGDFLTVDLNEDYVHHEDTEELNALLYSDDDDDDDSEDGEVTSADHTRSLNKQDSSFEGYIEEVASSNEAITGAKQSEHGFEVFSSVNDTSSLLLKRKRSRSCCEYDDNAESSCGNVNNMCFDEIDDLSRNKKMKIEKIRETVSILKRVIPCGEGKEGIDVLDEAIEYLKFLKNNAKNLGLLDFI